MLVQNQPMQKIAPMMAIKMTACSTMLMPDFRAIAAHTAAPSTPNAHKMVALSISFSTGDDDCVLPHAHSQEHMQTHLLQFIGVLFNVREVLRPGFLFPRLFISSRLRVMQRRQIDCHYSHYLKQKAKHHFSSCASSNRINPFRSK